MMDKIMEEHVDNKCVPCIYFQVHRSREVKPNQDLYYYVSPLKQRSLRSCKIFSDVQVMCVT